jgi:hypothetical protein
VDMDGEVWHPEHYKGGMYFRKTGSQYRVAQSTLKRKSKPCNILI